MLDECAFGGHYAVGEKCVYLCLRALVCCIYIATPHISFDNWPQVLDAIFASLSEAHFVSSDVEQLLLSESRVEIIKTTACCTPHLHYWRQGEG